MKTRKELEAELNALIEEEQKALIEKHYLKFKKYEGKYFKTTNSFGGGSKSWWRYTKVTKVKPGYIYDTYGNGVTSHFDGWSFETDSMGNIHVEKEQRRYIHSLSTEISEAEFNLAWNKMVDKLNDL